MPQLDPTRPLCEDNITVSGIEKLVKQLNPTKASGPDNISPRVLKEVASEIAPSLILIYRASMKSGTVPKDWKSARRHPYSRKGNDTSLKITGPSPSPAYLASFLSNSFLSMA